MRRDNNKTWFHYVKDIIASDLTSAVLLTSYLRKALQYKTYVSALDVIEWNGHQMQPNTAPIRFENMPPVLVFGKN